MRYSLFLLMFFSIQNVIGQVDWRIYNTQDSIVLDENILEEFDTSYDNNGALIIYSDPRIDSLVNTMDEYPPLLKGYRLEIFFGNRKEAEKVKSEFLKRYDQFPIYIIWQQPNFKVHVGDFMTKLQAEKAQQEIKNGYPNSYIVITEIKMAD